MLASRIDSLLDSVGAGSRTSPAQSGATGLTVDTPASPDGAGALGDTPPPASAQAVLSEVALTLDAISRFGGEATPAVIGEAPIWPAPPAIDTPAAGNLFTADSGSTAGGAATAAAGAPAAGSPAAGSPAAGSPAAPSPSSSQAGSTTGTAAVGAAATAMPVAELAAALEQTVNESGLFYESHLAEWLSGGYPADALANEPQTRLAGQTLQLPLDWGQSSADSNAGGTPAWLASGGAGTGGAGWLPHELPPQFSLPTGPHAGAASDGAAWRGASASGFDDTQAARTGTPTPDLRASIAASLHPATIPLVRQQLDVLATQQFRWTGEVWPGAKLDWTIEPERERRNRPGDADEADAQQRWRTRVTLALPTLGTVDADLVLTGSQLVVRVQASPGGAARLVSGGAAFGRRLQAAGIELAGLQIREIGGASPAAAGGAASTATSAYARTAAAAAAEAEAQARDASNDVLDVEVRDGPLPGAGALDAGGRAAGADSDTSAKRGPVPSPIDRLFDDPFEWSGS
jgi:hypothetical protein